MLVDYTQVVIVEWVAAVVEWIKVVLSGYSCWRSGDGVGKGCGIILDGSIGGVDRDRDVIVWVDVVEGWLDRVVKWIEIVI